MTWGCEEVPLKMLVSVLTIWAFREGHRCKKKTPDEHAITTNTSDIKPFTSSRRPKIGLFALI